MSGRIFVCGDTHGLAHDTHKLNSRNFPEQKVLDKDDVLIQLGDFGWVWYPFGENKEQEYWLDWLASKNYTLGVVLGNHENYDMIEQLPSIEKWGNEVKVLKREKGEILFFRRGAVYTINEKKILTIGGAVSVDKLRRTPHISWWEQEELSFAETEACLAEIERHGTHYDHILTHTCPARYVQYFNKISEKQNCSVAKFLDHIDDITTCDSWHFGHFHEDMAIKENRYRCHYNEKPFELSTDTVYTEEIKSSKDIQSDEIQKIGISHFDLPVYYSHHYGKCVLRRDIQKLPIFDKWLQVSNGSTMGYSEEYGGMVYLHDWERFCKLHRIEGV